MRFSMPFVPEIDDGIGTDPVPDLSTRERTGPHTMAYTAPGKHNELYPPPYAFFILPVRFPKYFFQIPLFARNNEKFDQHNE